MANPKVIFVAFAIEDEKQRDLLKGQSLHPRAPYEFIDMSVKEAYDSGCPAGHFKFLRVWSVKFLHPRGRT